MAGTMKPKAVRRVVKKMNLKPKVARVVEQVNPKKKLKVGKAAMGTRMKAKKKVEANQKAAGQKTKVATEVVTRAAVGEVMKKTKAVTKAQFNLVTTAGGLEMDAYGTVTGLGPGERQMRAGGQ